MTEIQRVGVVGCGLMGSGIAEVCARAGLDVVVTEVNPDALAAGRKRIVGSLDRALTKGKLDGDAYEATLGRLKFTDDIGEFADVDLAVEAVAEIEQIKLDIFASLDKVIRNRDAILASNTSSIPIMKLGMATSRPEMVIGIHFFNPVPVLKLVELVSSLLTDPQTAVRAAEFAETKLNKQVVRSQDRAGFIVNALLIPYILSAVRMMDSGFASADDIDHGMVLGCAHPMGPLALADLIGLDTIKHIADSMFEEFKEPLYYAPPLLLRMVDAGLLGKKSGRGFHTYA
ncbi:MAG: 3-hydroxybutyryl-CoA dehydrogenase [Sporichthyaceae bacterium]